MDRSLILVLLAGLLLGGILGCDLLGLGEEEPLGRIVFTRSDSTETGPRRFVYTMNTDGSDLTRLTFPDETLPCGPEQEQECGVGTAYRARWGPEGKRIAYTGSFGPEEFHITVMNADGSDKRAIAGFTGGSADKPRWSPDGERILIRQREVLGITTGTYVVNADGTEITCIVCLDKGPVTFQRDTLSASTVQWGPTSDLLYLFSYPDDVERLDQFESLYLFRISTREVVRKVASIDLQEGLTIRPNGTISPDGERILFADQGNVYLSSPPGAPAEKLTTGPNCQYGSCGDVDVNWGDDGRHFVYARLFEQENEGEENGERSHIRLGDVAEEGDGRRVSPVSGRYPDLFIPGE